VLGTTIHTKNAQKDSVFEKRKFFHRRGA